MRSETIYYAFDETEFDNEADCLAYENEYYQKMGSVAAYDESLTFIGRPTDEQWASDVMFMKILDGETATWFVRWIHGWCGMNIDGLGGELHTGDVWAWDDDEGMWYKPLEQLAELQALADRINEAVNAS